MRRDRFTERQMVSNLARKPRFEDRWWRSDSRSGIAGMDRLPILHFQWLTDERQSIDAGEALVVQAEDVEMVEFVDAIPEPADRARRCGRHMKGRDRAIKVHVQVRVPAGAGEGLKRVEAIGIDHGLVHPMTTYDSQGNIHHYHHREVELARLDRQTKKVQETLRNCRPGSRKWRKRQRVVKSLRAQAVNIRSHDRRQWAVGLAKGYETVCCERMDVRQLVASHRGTHEKHGELVNVQRERSGRLANAAPGEQRAELKAACERHGAKYIETPARNSSEFCPECHHCTKENRKSQARFRCTKCGHAENADGNAARNHLRWGISADHRAAVRRSWEEAAPPKRQAGGGNPVRAPKANSGNAGGRRRDPGPGPSSSPERDPPPGVMPGTTAGASEAAPSVGA